MERLGIGGFDILEDRKSLEKDRVFLVKGVVFNLSTQLGGS